MISFNVRTSYLPSWSKRHKFSFREKLSPQEVMLWVKICLLSLSFTVLSPKCQAKKTERGERTESMCQKCQRQGKREGLPGNRDTFVIHPPTDSRFRKPTGMSAGCNQLIFFTLKNFATEASWRNMTAPYEINDKNLWHQSAFAKAVLTACVFTTSTPRCAEGVPTIHTAVLVYRTVFHCTYLPPVLWAIKATQHYFLV